MVFYKRKLSGFSDIGIKEFPLAENQMLQTKGTTLVTWKSIGNINFYNRNAPDKRYAFLTVTFICLYNRSGRLGNISTCVCVCVCVCVWQNVKISSYLKTRLLFDRLCVWYMCVCVRFGKMVRLALYLKTRLLFDRGCVWYLPPHIFECSCTPQVLNPQTLGLDDKC